MTDPTFVVLLRGVNLGPHRRVSAADLRAAAQDAGMASPRTLLNSGNVVGRVTPGATEAAVAARVAAALEQRLGQQVPVVAVAADRLADVVAANPFPDAARDDPSHLVVLVPAGPVDADGIARLAREHAGPERLALAAGVLFVDFRAGMASSRLTAARIDRAAGTWLTGRNWNTTTRLLALARELGG